MHAPAVPLDEGVSVAVGGEPPLVEELGDALLGMDVVRDLWEVRRLAGLVGLLRPV